MKFAIVSNNKDIQLISRILSMFDIDIDNNKPDFVITLGGDGTILFSERKYPGIPKITLRGSERGLKCNFNENELEDVLINMDIGKYKIKEETKLETTFQGKKYLSLNEVQIHNSSPIKSLRFSIYEDGKPLFENVIGDGAVIATPFGSTAYFSSIGGEKFDKGIGVGLNNLYNVEDFEMKYVILNPNTNQNIDINPKIDIKILRDDGLLLFDNDENIVKIRKGDEIHIEISKNTAKFIVDSG